MDTASHPAEDTASSPTEYEAGGETGIAEPVATARLPSYSFAKRHGVLVTYNEHGDAQVLYKAGVSSKTLIELRRFIGRPLQLSLAGDDFDSLLTKTYDRSSAGAQAMVDDMTEEDMDLYQVAESLPEPEDLLESEDDAPIIRLLNALLSQAIKENASDIHIEPFESRLLVRMRVDGYCGKYWNRRAVWRH